jgi:hypothetical protein
LLTINVEAPHLGQKVNCERGCDMIPIVMKEFDRHKKSMTVKNFLFGHGSLFIAKKII